MENATDSTTESTTETAVEPTVEETAPVETESASEPEAKKTESNEEPSESEDDVDVLKAELAKKTAFSRKHENRVKELVSEKKAWEQERIELEATLHKTKTELASFQKEATEAKLSALKAQAATEYKLPEGAIKHLKGESEEEIKASAEDLANTFGVLTSPKKVISTQGSGSTAKPTDHIEALKQWQAANFKR